MLKIILNEFHRNNYVTISEEKDIVFLKHQEFNDFWIVYQKSFDLDRQSELYEQYISQFATDYPFVKKNTSLLILAVDNAITHEKVVAIENDPFLFKKYFLSYSQASLDELKSLLAAQDGSYIPIETLMVSADVFTQLKKENTEGVYHLLYAIAHKLPILPVNVNHEEIMGINLNLNKDQRSCLEWCIGLSKNDIERKAALEQFSKE